MCGRDVCTVLALIQNVQCWGFLCVCAYIFVDSVWSCPGCQVQVIPPQQGTKTLLLFLSSSDTQRPSSDSHLCYQVTFFGRGEGKKRKKKNSDAIIVITKNWDCMENPVYKISAHTLEHTTEMAIEQKRGLVCISWLNATWCTVSSMWCGSCLSRIIND